jgi:hypothetical protein
MRFVPFSKRRVAMASAAERRHPASGHPNDRFTGCRRTPIKHRRIKLVEKHAVQRSVLSYTRVILRSQLNISSSLLFNVRNGRRGGANRGGRTPPLS